MDVLILIDTVYQLLRVALIEIKIRLHVQQHPERGCRVGMAKNGGRVAAAVKLPISMHSSLRKEEDGGAGIRHGGGQQRR